MAVKKTEEVIEEVKTVEEDPWKIMKSVRIPRGGKNEEKTFFISVNDHTFLIPKGQDVEVPLPIYERIEIMRKAIDALNDYVDEIPNEG